MDDTVAAPYRYWAFVSYSRHDARVAGELVRRLAEVPVPRDRRATVAGAPATFAPLFLDTRDASAAPELDAELQRALRDSARLVVLCSPFAVQSGYVADEIRYFQGLGRSADILCLIVSGEPDATERGRAALECFPAPLRVPATAPGQRPPRPLAAALGRESRDEWRSALEQLAAGLAGLPLPVWRDAVSRRRTRRLALAGAGVLTAAGLAWAAVWATWLPHEVYAKQAVRRWGALQPIDEVSAATAARRPLTYRFERRGAFGPWTVARAVDGSGQCPRDESAIQSIVGEGFHLTCTRSRACAVEMSIAGGRIASEKVLDQYGQVLETVAYGDERHAVLTEAVVGCSRREGNIEYVQIERHESGPLAGLDRVLRFGGGDDKSPRPNSDYAFGWQIEYDARGRVTELRVLDAEGRPRLGRTGYAAQHYVYNAAGDLVEVTTLGLNGRPIDARSGFATLRFEVDGAGRRLERHTFDAEGRAVQDELGLYGSRTAYDARGRVAAMVNLGADGKPAPDSHGVAQLRIAYGDAAGSETASFLDVAGHPMPEDTLGCSGMARREPPGENWLERRCLDSQGRPAYSKAGWHLARTTYGPRGEETGEAYFDTAGSRTLCTDEASMCPHHRSENIVDERGNAVSGRLFDIDGSPAIAAIGVSRVDRVFDASNRVRLIVNRGPDGQPTRSREQTVAVERVYDSYGRLVETRRVDPDGHPLLLGLRTYARRVQYDDLGNEVLVEFLDVDGKRVKDDLGSGYAAVRQRFDPRGNLAERRFFDERDQPTADDQGWYGYRVGRDRWGRETSFTRLGPDGQPQPGADGEFERRIELDPQGHRIRFSLHDADGRSVARSDGVSQWAWSVDTRGNRTRERRLGPAGQLVADREGSVGFDARFDERGHQVEYLKIGLDGEPTGDRSTGIARIASEMDALGRVQVKRFFDRDGRPRANNDGVFGYAFRYNARGQSVEERHLAADGSVAASRSGVARIETDFDAAGGMTEQRSYGVDGKPSNTGQAAIVRHRNDPSGREIERSFFDAGDKPMESPQSGRWRVVLTRDVWGRLVEEQSLGKDGRPVNQRDNGWSRRTLHYGNMGELEQVRCFDTAGHPVKNCAQTE